MKTEGDNLQSREIHLFIYLAICFLSQCSTFLARDKKGPCFKATYRAGGKTYPEEWVCMLPLLSEDPSLNLPQPCSFLVTQWSSVFTWWGILTYNKHRWNLRPPCKAKSGSHPRTNSTQLHLYKRHLRYQKIHGDKNKMVVVMGVLQ